MNLFISGAPRWLRVAATFVAACFLVTACSSAASGPKVSAVTPTPSVRTATPSPSVATPSPDTTVTNGIIDVSRHDPAVGDSLKLMSQKDLSGLDDYRAYWGLDHIYVPSAAGQSGFEGVAPLGKYCLVLISHIQGMDDGTNRASLVVISRYNDTIEAYARGISFPDGVNGALGMWREACWTGYYVPTPGDGNTKQSPGTIV